MIVIASYNGIKFLPNLINSLETYGPFDQKYLVVNSQSNDPESLEYLNSLSSNKIDISVVECPFNAYDTGAYIWSYRNFIDSEYMFLQDSLEIKQSNWLDNFRDKFSEKIDNAIVPWLVFDGGYDNQEQRDFIQNSLSCSDTCGWGVFGPIFYTRRSILDLMESQNLLNVKPSNKNEQMGMERGWSAIVNRLGLSYSFIHYYNHNSILEDKYSLFKKYLPRR